MRRRPRRAIAKRTEARLDVRHHRQERDANLTTTSQPNPTGGSPGGSSGMGRAGPGPTPDRTDAGTITVCVYGYGDQDRGNRCGDGIRLRKRLWGPQRVGYGASARRTRALARREGAQDGSGGAQSTLVEVDEAPVVERCAEGTWKRREDREEGG